METKKSPKVDLERKRGLFFQIGLIMSLAVVLIAFEWTTKTEQKSVRTNAIEAIADIDHVQRTTTEKQQPKQPVAPSIDFNIVDDSEILDDPWVMPDPTIKVESGIEFLPMKDEKIEDSIFIVVQKMPVFPLGEFRDWVNSNVQYPELALDIGIEGTVRVNFVVDKKGNVVNTEITRGVDPSLENEVIRVLNLSPKWKPGEQWGRKVNVQFNIPVAFVLNK